MTQYIDKSALVAELKKLKEEIESQDYAAYTESYIIGAKHTLETISDILDSLEVKEVDFDAEWERYFEHRGEMATVNVKHLAKHFFELGIKASNTLTWEDINSIDHLLFDIKEDYDNGKLDKEKYYKEVLKKFKAQL